MFGHVPLLTDPIYASYMEAYGRAGWKALKYNRLKALSALYWYTVEFGLILEDDQLRIYGAGILSGPTETVFAVEGRSPNRIHLNVDRVMRTDYTISDLQATYFVIESFRELFHLTEQRGFEPIYESLAPAFQYAKTAALDTDHIYHRGTQEYEFAAGGDRARRLVDARRLQSPRTSLVLCCVGCGILLSAVARRSPGTPIAFGYHLAPGDGLAARRRHPRVGALLATRIAAGNAAKIRWLAALHISRSAPRWPSGTGPCKPPAGSCSATLPPVASCCRVVFGAVTSRRALSPCISC